MKKTFGRKLAFLVAATLLAAGAFASCTDEKEEKRANTPADSLAKPDGIDPFTTGTYRAEIYDDDEHSYRMYYTFDTSNRTVNVDEHRDELYRLMKYTYTANTVTMAIYKLYMPSDIDAWISFWLSGDDTKYPTEWKFVGKSECISFTEKVRKKIIPLIEQQLQDTTLSDKTREELEDDLNYWKNDAVAEASKEFDKPAVIYVYAKAGNVITLTSETEKLILTPVND